MKKQTILYSVVGIVSLIVVASAFYYFVVFLTQQNENSRIFSANQKCREVGEKLYQENLKVKEERIRQGINIGRYFSVFDPEYTFNQRLNTCLYAGGYIQGDPTGSEAGHWVKDTLTNKEILRFYTLTTKDKAEPYIEECEYCTASLEEFKKQKEELFK